MVDTTFPECDRFQSSKQRAICRGEDLTPELCDNARIRWGLPPLNPAGPGSEFKALANSLGIANAKGCDCEAIRREMDQLGVDGCRRDRDRLIASIRENAAKVSWLQKAMAVVPALLTGIAFVVDPLDPVPGLFDEAVRLAEEKQKTACKPRTRSAKKCGCGKAKKSGRQKPAKHQPLDLPVFNGPVTRHLIYHLFPAKHSDQWQWNLDELLKRINIFNGRRIIGLSISRATVPAQQVREYLDGHGFEFVEVSNDPKRGELTSFTTMMQRIQTEDPNAIVFYAHGKGTSCAPGGKTLSGGRLPDMRRWADAMYRGCLDNMGRVDAALESQAFAGGFRRNYGNGRWFYSGTFFWFRAAAVFGRKWKITSKQRWAVEFWPATMFPIEQTACLFGDGVRSLYDPKQLTAAIDSMDRPAGVATTKPDREVSIVTKPAEPGVTLITPTGDRPVSFALCEHWMRRQTYRGPVQWIVTDDGSVPTTVTAGQEYHRLPPRKGNTHTLPRNLRHALARVRHDKLLIIEDDDWYAADYVEKQVARLDVAPMVGASFARYYWPRLARFREFPDHPHASLCRTGIRREHFGDLLRCTDGNQSVDLRLWDTVPGRRFDDEILCISPKGMPGRPSGGGDPDDGRPDSDLSVLRRWIGEDLDLYRQVLPKSFDPGRARREKIVVYTVVLGRYDAIRPPLVVNPDVSYVAITDGSAPAPWQVVRPPRSKLSRVRQTRHLKLLAHKLFPDADWTIYYDGQLQLAVDPVALLSECEAWGPAELYLFRHQDRECLYAEATEVVRIGKDQRANVTPVIERFRRQGVPERAGLYLGGMLIRRRWSCDAFNARWWSHVAAGSHRDQISLPVALAESGVQFTALPAMWWGHFFLRHKHTMAARPSLTGRGTPARGFAPQSSRR